MAALVALYTKVAGMVVSLSTMILGKCGALLAKLGVKLLSFNWIEKVVEVFKTVLDFIKKFLFNEKVIAILRFLLSLGLTAIAFVQVFLIVKVFVVEFNSFKDLLLLKQVEIYIALAILKFGVIATTVFAIKNLIGTFKKKIDITFIPILVSTYVLIAFLSGLIPKVFFVKIVGAFSLMMVLAIVTYAFAIVKLFDLNVKASFGAFLFSTIAIFVVFWSFNNQDLALFLNYQIGGELSFSPNQVNFIAVLRSVGNLDLAVGLDYSILNACYLMQVESGAFLSALAVTLNVILIVVSNIIPYALLLLVGGFVVALISDRFVQSVYLSRVLNGLKYLFIAMLICTVIIIVLPMIICNDYMVITVNVKGVIVAHIIIIALAIITAIARHFVVNKLYKSAKFTKVK